MTWSNKKEIFMKTIIIDKDVAVIGWFPFFHFHFCQAKTGSAPSDPKRTSRWAMNQEIHKQRYGLVMTSLWLLDWHCESTVEPRTPEETKTTVFNSPDKVGWTSCIQLDSHPWNMRWCLRFWTVISQSARVHITLTTSLITVSTFSIIFCYKSKLPCHLFTPNY